MKAQKQRLERLLTLQFDPDSTARVAAIDSFGTDLGLDIRVALNPILVTKRLSIEEERKALVANLTNGSVGGIALADLNTQAARDRV